MCPSKQAAPAAAVLEGRRQTVALFNQGGQGHLNPMLALAEGMLKQRWEVHFFTPKVCRAQVEGTGAIWCHYGAEDWSLDTAAKRVAVERLQVEPDREVFESKMTYQVIPATLEVLPFLVGRMAQILPDFIVFDGACPWAWVLSHFLRIPAICSMTALPAPPHDHESGSAKWSSTRTLDAAVEAIRAAYGVSLNHNYSYANYTPYTIVWSSRCWHEGNEEFSPDKFHYWGPLTTTRKSIGEGASGDRVRKSLAELGDKRLVFVSLGTVATGNRFPEFAPTLEDFYRKMCAVAASMPEAAFIFALGRSLPAEADGEGCIRSLFKDIEVPANVTAAPSVDQLAVLEKASAFVTHCGMNSSSEAVLNGVPVVTVPFYGDQLENSARFEQLGCGIPQSYSRGIHSGHGWQPDHDLDLVSEDSLGTAIHRVLEEPQFKDAICALRDRQADECGQPLDEKLASLLRYVEEFERSGDRMFA